jgi:hypothetical protein
LLLASATPRNPLPPDDYLRSVARRSATGPGWTLALGRSASGFPRMSPRCTSLCLTHGRRRKATTLHSRIPFSNPQSWDADPPGLVAFQTHHRSKGSRSSWSSQILLPQAPRQQPATGEGAVRVTSGLEDSSLNGSIACRRYSTQHEHQTSNKSLYLIPVYP